jgi:transcriptional regulator with XRE-family HTH domain
MSERAASALGDRLRDLRQERGLTLAEVAENVELAPSYLHYLEAGERKKPHPDYLNRLARFYGVLVEDLYALAGYTPADELPELRAYLRSKYGLSTEVIREIENYKDFLTEREDDAESTQNPPSSHRPSQGRA